jgi:hypothetical protein
MIATCFRAVLTASVLALSASGVAFAEDAKKPEEPAARPGICPAESFRKLLIVTKLKQLGHIAGDFPTLDLTEGRIGCQAPAFMAAVKLYQKSIKCPETGGLDQAQMDHLAGISAAAPDCSKGAAVVAIAEPPDPAVQAKTAFEGMRLSEDGLKRLYRGLYRLKFVNSEIIETGFDKPELVSAVKAFQVDRRAPQTGYLTPEQVSYLDWVGEHPFPDELNQQIEADWNFGGKDWRTVYNQFAAYLSYNGVERDAGAVTRDDIKTIQRHAELAETGYLSPELYNYVSGQPKRFKPRDFGSGSKFGDWVSVHVANGKDNFCFIEADAMSIEGAYGQDQTGYLYFSYDPAWNNGNLHIRFGEVAWFDTDEKITLEANGESIELVKNEDGYLKPTIEPKDNSVQTTAFKALAEAAVVQIKGSSALGGPLSLYYANGGFKRALQDMNHNCAGDRLDVWLE